MPPIMRIQEGSDDFFQAEYAFRSVFLSAGLQARDVFSSSISRKMLIYPSWYMIDEDLFSSVAEASILLGVRTAYISLSEWYNLDMPFNTIWHFKIDLSNYDYEMVCEQAAVMMGITMYAQNGSWGLLTSDYNCAVIGGPHRFISHIEAAFGSLESTREFIRTSFAYPLGLGNLDWLLHVIEEVYDEDTAIRLLDQYI